MKAIVVTDEAAGTAGMKLVERPEPQRRGSPASRGASSGDVVVHMLVNRKCRAGEDWIQGGAG